MAFAWPLQNNFLGLKKHWLFSLLVAVGALIFYTATLSRGVTLTSLTLTTKIAGWDWLPLSEHPLAWLLTLPLRLLPNRDIPWALNFFSAVTAAAVLGILARSMQLLKWDCPPDPQKNWARQLPILFAVGVCGLEFNFWQEATALSGEMLELLLFAAAIWCLLEFRRKKNLRWLDAAVVIWGIGLAENWAMQLMLPAFVFTVIWWRGENYFNRRFWLRSLLLGLAGFSIFIWLPLANAMALHSPWSVTECWLAPWHQTRELFHNLYFGLWSWRRLLALTLVFYFLVPVLVCSVRISNEAVPNLFGMERLRIAIFRTLRGGLLLACVWLACDPEVGPRKLVLHQLKVAWPLLTFDYLLALGAGFLLGSLIYATHIPTCERPATPFEIVVSFFRRWAWLPLTLFAVLVLTGLAMRSGQGITQSRSAALSVSGEIMARSLPPEGGVLLANDAVLLAHVQAALAQKEIAQRWQFVDLSQLPGGKYRAAMERQSPGGWLLGGTQNLSANTQSQLLAQLAARHRLFYLQPEPGHFLFETFYSEPLGAVQELKVLPPNTFLTPPLTPKQIAENELFWDAIWKNNLEPVSHFCPVTSGKSAAPQWRLLPVESPSVRQVGKWYAIALNNWGVELQRNGKLAEAKRRFEQAHVLNADNIAASMNLRGNANLLAAKPVDLSATLALAKNAVSLSQLTRLMSSTGTFDEAMMCLLLGEACANKGMPRQALQQLDRAKILAPNLAEPELAMAKIYSNYGMAEKVLELVKDLRRFETNLHTSRALGVELALLEAKAWLGKSNVLEANRVLETVLQKNTDSPAVWETVFHAYLAFGSPTNALTVLDRMLAKNSDNLPALNNKAALLLQSQRPLEALPILDQALAITNLPGIRLNRAIALFQSKKITEAEQAFRELQTTTADSFSVAYGLAQIFEVRRDMEAAAKQYAICLTNTLVESPKWREVKARLDTLKTPTQR